MDEALELSVIESETVVALDGVSPLDVLPWCEFDGPGASEESGVIICSEEPVFFLICPVESAW